MRICMYKPVEDLAQNVSESHAEYKEHRGFKQRFSDVTSAVETGYNAERYNSEYVVDYRGTEYRRSDF